MPREASRVTLADQDVPHWIAIEPNHRRVVITGYVGLKNRVILANFDEITGQLTIDKRFRDEGAAQPGLERHTHQHAHVAMEHDHAHVHDEHHQHPHGPGDPAIADPLPHRHWHRHAPLVHRHTHYPDIHHRHDHER